MTLEENFNIEDTWLFMGLLAQREEAEVTQYIQSKKHKHKMTSQDVADVEYAAEIRSTLKEAKENCRKRSMQEKGGQYNREALEKLLKWGVISEEEKAVMQYRATSTYREIGKTMQIHPSTAYRTVERVHKRVRALYRQVSIIRPDEAADKEKIEANAKRIQDRILEAQLSVQQWDIYLLLCKGLSNNEIALRLGVKKETVKSQKTRINKAREKLNRATL